MDSEPMTEQITTIILDEGKWVFAAMLVSLTVVAVQLVRLRGEGSSHRIKILTAMNLFFGGFIGTMSGGHLLAVTIKLLLGTLEGSVWLLYPLGLVLAVPAWWLAARVIGYLRDEDQFRKKIVTLNAWIGICLLAFGLSNFPLALPAGLNIAYQFHSSRALGWTIVTVAAATVLALFIGSAVFLASGLTFEQFVGID